MAKRKKGKKEKATYAFKMSNCAAVPAQVIGEEMERIEARDGSVTSQALVDESTPDDAALHACFTWDNDVAGNAFRCVEAGRVVRSICVVTGGQDRRDARPAYVSVVTRRPEGEDGEAAGRRHAYVNVSRMTEEEEIADGVLKQAISQLNGLRRRYSTLAELSPLWEALDEIEAAAV